MENRNAVSAAAVSSKLHHSLKSLASTSKKARTFELQRLVKKLRNASDAEKELLHQDLEALKAMDHRLVAQQSLRGKLIKANLMQKGKAEAKTSELHAIISEGWNTAVPEFSGETLNNVDANMERILARIGSNKHFSQAVSEKVKDIRNLVDGKGRTKPSKESAKSEKEDIVDHIAAEDNMRKRKKVSTKPPQLEERNSAKVKNNIDSEGSLYSDKEEETQLQSDLDISSRSEVEEDIEEDISSAAEEEEESGILPALSTGFVGGRGFRFGRESDDEWSDGDAELEEVDEDAEDRPKKKARKNRMGQRARRAIWEKKFGRNANHLRVRRPDKKEDKNRRSNYFTHSKVNVSADDGWKSKTKAHVENINKSPSNNGQESKPKKVAEPHPSWIAKQRQKEKEMALFSTQPATKKVVFD